MTQDYKVLTVFCATTTVQKKKRKEKSLDPWKECSVYKQRYRHFLVQRQWSDKGRCYWL